MKLILGDSLEKLKELEDNSVDSIVTDPPYHLVSIVKRFGKENSAPAKYGKDGSFGRLSKGFMGKQWDGLDENGIGIAQNVELWEECLRVLKPGGYLLAFAGTRTSHRMACAIEDAGFEIRDMIAWVYGSGFPKSHNIGKAVDKLQGNERKVLDYAIRPDGSNPRTNVKAHSAQFGNSDSNDQRPTKGNSPYEGWGTALKPALEPITVARKPISEKTVALNVLKYGTGGINIDGCRVEYTETNKPIPQLAQNKREIKTDNGMYGGNSFTESKTKSTIGGSLDGRFPANLIHDGSDEVVGLFPDTGKGNNGIPYNYAGTEYNNKDTSMFNGDKPQAPSNFNDSGSASRFFYCAKASKSERNKGLEEFEEKQTTGGGGLTNVGDKFGSIKAKQTNSHPTVKPISLMRYLVRLVTPKGGIVLDPFMGSGTTGIGAKLEGFDFIGIEREEEYIKIAEARINAWQKDNKLL